MVIQSVLTEILTFMFSPIGFFANFLGIIYLVYYFVSGGDLNE